MLNTEDFIQRLEFIMEHFGLSASSFADKISVQRSSISHLLSGRNKPSLDFVMKVLDFFPELNLYWLLNGSGTYLKKDSEEITVNEVQNTPTPITENKSKEFVSSIYDENTVDRKNDDLVPNGVSFPENVAGKQIDKIVLFYTDGTFQDYKPSH